MRSQVSTSTWSVAYRGSLVSRISLAREFVASEKATAAYQTEVSTNKLMYSAPLTSFEVRLNRFADHLVFVQGDIGGAAAPEVEDTAHIRFGPRTSEIFPDQPAEVFRKRHSHLAGALAGTLVGLGFKRDLCACHHDGAIIPPPLHIQP